jgi:hypothetical protein
VEFNVQIDGSRALAAVERVHDQLLGIRRLNALMFAARLRGARDRDDMISWGVGQGYIEPVFGETTEHRLTEAGIARADEIIEADPEMFDG